MTSTVAVTNGVGVQTGKLFAFDGASTVNLTGLASTYNGLALTAYIATRDGKRALAPLATATAGTTTASFTFDFRTSACRGLFTSGAEAEQTVRLRVLVTATSQVVADAPMVMVPGPEAGTTTTSAGSAGASLAEAQALVDAHNASASAHAALFAATVTRATADGEALADANRFEVGQFIGGVWVYCVKTGTQIKVWLKTYFDGLYATAAQGTLATNAVPKATGTTAGDRLRWTASGTVARQPATVALPDAGAGAWAPALTAGADHTVTRTGIWTAINPSGLEIGEDCGGVITGAYDTTTTGVTADKTGDLTDITAASVGFYIIRRASGYRMTCWEMA